MPTTVYVLITPLSSLRACRALLGADYCAMLVGASCCISRSGLRRLIRTHTEELSPSRQRLDSPRSRSRIVTLVSSLSSAHGPGLQPLGFSQRSSGFGVRSSSASVTCRSTIPVVSTIRRPRAHPSTMPGVHKKPEGPLRFPAYKGSESTDSEVVSAIEYCRRNSFAHGDYSARRPTKSISSFGRCGSTARPSASVPCGTPTHRRPRKSKPTCGRSMRTSTLTSQCPYAEIRVAFDETDGARSLVGTGCRKCSRVSQR